MIKLFELKIEDSHNFNSWNIVSIAAQELAFLEMENDWTNTTLKLESISFKSNPRVLVYNFVFYGEGIPISND